MPWAEYSGLALANIVWVSGGLNDDSRNEAWGSGEAEFWRFWLIYARLSDPCDIKKGEEVSKSYILVTLIRKRYKSKYILVWRMVFCRPRDATGDGVWIGEEFLHGAEGRGRTWESKRCCGCKRSKLGFLSNRLGSLKFCRFKVLEGSKSLVVRSFSMCARLWDVGSRLSIGFVRSSMVWAVFLLLIRPNILVSIMQECLKTFQEK